MENTVSDPIRKEGNDNFFESFRTVSEQRPLSLFLGAGLDADAGFPGLLELLKPVAKDLKVSIDDKTDLFELAQFYEDKYNRNELLEKIKKRLQSSNRDSHLLSTVMQLNFRTIWTTNYDSMIEDYLKKQDTPFSKIYKPQQLNEIRENAINLIKINGDLDSYESIIIDELSNQVQRLPKENFSWRLPA